MANGKQKNQNLAEISSPGVTGNESPFLSDSNGTDKPARAGRGLEPALEDVLETPRGAGGLETPPGARSSCCVLGTLMLCVPA